MKLIIRDSVHTEENNQLEIEVKHNFDIIKLILKSFEPTSFSYSFKALLGLDKNGNLIITNYDSYIE